MAQSRQGLEGLATNLSKISFRLGGGRKKPESDCSAVTPEHRIHESFYRHRSGRQAECKKKFSGLVVPYPQGFHTCFHRCLSRESTSAAMSTCKARAR